MQNLFENVVIEFTKTEFANKKIVKQKLSNYLPQLARFSKYYSEEEMSFLSLGKIRADILALEQLDKAKNINVVQIKNVSRSRKKYLIDMNRLLQWSKELIPHTVTIDVEDPDFIRLLLFCLAIAYKMYGGQTRATLSEKIGRGKGRDFMQIFSDQFIGRIGEIAVRKYLKESFKENIILDWEISTEFYKYKTDIVNSKVPISIKSTDTLESIWAECQVDLDYGVFVKVAVPKDFFLKLLAGINSLTKFLGFMENIITKTTPADEISIRNLEDIRENVFSEPLSIKALICGFFRTTPDTLFSEGYKLPFLGKVYNKKYLIVYTKLKNSTENWEQFLGKVLTNTNHKHF